MKAAAAGDAAQSLSEVAEIEQRGLTISPASSGRTRLTACGSGNCNVESSILYSEMLTDYERIGDHMLNIAQGL